MKLNKKSLVLLVCITLLLAFTVSGTVAFLADNSGPVVNEFTPVNVTPSVTESFDHKVKKDVQIKNSGNIDAYIRAMVIITWQNGAGDVLAAQPVEGNDYTIKWGSGWALGSDGFYYHNTKVAPGALTSILIDSCQPIAAAPETDYTLHVEILAQSIQAQPTTAVTSAWGVSVDAAGNISK